MAQSKDHPPTPSSNLHSLLNTPGLDLKAFAQLCDPPSQPQSPTTTRSGRVSRPPPEPESDPSAPGDPDFPPSSRDISLRKIGRPVVLGPDERLARQRKRNRESAMRARQRKKEQDDHAYRELELKTEECVALEAKCKALEAKVRDLQALLQRSQGLSPRAVQLLLPTVAPESEVLSTTSTATAAPTPPAAREVAHTPLRWWNPAPSPAATPVSYLRGAPAQPQTIQPQTTQPQTTQPLTYPSAVLQPTENVLPPNGGGYPFPPADGAYMDTAAAPPPALDFSTMPDLSKITLPETFAGGDDYELLSLSALFGFDDQDADDAEDADFIPPTSPKADEYSSDEGGDDGDGDGDEDDDDDDGDGGGDDEDEDGEEEDHERHERRKRRKTAGAGAGSTSGDDDFIPEPQPEAEDEEEDLFLPIEDVPVPVDQLYRDAMEALGVSTQAELGAVVGRIVDAASKGKVTAEEVEGIRRLMRLAEAQGMYRSG